MAVLTVGAPLSTWHGTTTWTVGVGALGGAPLAQAAGRKPLIVIDHGLLRSQDGVTVLERLGRALSATIEPDLVIQSSPTPPDVVALHSRVRHTDPTAIIALGGGSAMDLSALATIDQAPQVMAALGKSRSGFCVLPDGARSLLRRVAVPSTLGTGAEVSAVACCDSDRGKHLVMGQALRPEYAFVDPLLTRSLPSPLVREAIIEILARVLVPVAQHPVPVNPVIGMSDAVAHASLAELGRHAWADSLNTASDDVRLALAAISAHTHGGWGQVGRFPFASPVWFAATEMAAVLRWSKVRATARLLPAWAHLVRHGERAWGDAGRMAAAWGFFDPTGQEATSRLTEACARLCPPDPGRVITPQQAGDLADEVVERLVRRWGGGLPMLARFTGSDLTRLVSLALATAPEAADGDNDEA